MYIIIINSASIALAVLFKLRATPPLRDGGNELAEA